MTKINYKETEQYQEGLQVFASKYEPYKQSLLNDLYDFSPELADVVVAHGLSDIWNRKTNSLTVQEKELAVLASLITSCTVPLEIKSHTECLLNVGVSKQQIKDLLTLLTLYIGVPKTIVAMKIIDATFKEYDERRK